MAKISSTIIANTPTAETNSLARPSPASSDTWPFPASIPHEGWNDDDRNWPAMTFLHYHLCRRWPLTGNQIMSTHIEITTPST